MNYPTSFNLSYLWNFGSLAGFCLMVQIVSGFFLATHYTADIATSFNSVEYIMRDVNYRWLFRYTHANGASMFLLLAYRHRARCAFYRFYFNRSVVFIEGVLLIGVLGGTAIPEKSLCL